MGRFTIIPLLLAAVLGAQAGGGEAAAPVASNPVVEVSGAIRAVHISHGQGMPYLEVQKGSEITRLYLGAMHYLIAQDFNPKTGQRVIARGYKTTDGVAGIQVTLIAEKKTLKLRDEKGWPLWRGGRQQGRGPRFTSTVR